MLCPVFPLQTIKKKKKSLIRSYIAFGEVIIFMIYLKKKVLILSETSETSRKYTTIDNSAMNLKAELKAKAFFLHFE